MTKTVFERWCEQSERGPDMPELCVRWGVESRGLDRSVTLHGYWAHGTVLEIELYKPKQGYRAFAKQGIGMYRIANEACEREAAKYSKWLEEWKERKLK